MKRRIQKDVPCSLHKLNTLCVFFVIFRFITGSGFVRHVLVDESQLLADIGERLNKDIRAIKNWRNLAYRLKIPPETYNTFDTSKAKAKSPTKMMFEWLAKWKPSLNVGDLLEAIREIDRYDVVELVKKEAELGEFVNTVEPPVSDYPDCQAYVVAVEGGRLREVL